MTKEEQINDIMDCFDFGKVRKAMLALNWTWITSESNEGAPYEYELRKAARGYLEKVCTLARSGGPDSYRCGSGGFEAEATKFSDGDVNLSLEFVVASWHNFKISEDE